MEDRERVAQAMKDEDVPAIGRLLHSCQNKEEKLSFLSALYEILPGGEKRCLKIVPDKANPFTVTEYQKQMKFHKDVTEMLKHLSGQDKIIEEFLESLKKQPFSKDNAKIGSGPDGTNLDHYYCANNDPFQFRHCLKPGNLRCGKCRLVGYCSASCQKEHWKMHKQVCVKSEFLSSKWQPSWVKEGRRPKFITANGGLVQLGLDIYLWGNTPAIDLVGWERNEYKETFDWQKPMEIAFAASGDLRSTIETLASIPESYQQPITVVLNDIHPFIVGRNLLMLSLLLFKGNEAIDTIIAIWYSAAMTECQDKNINEFICEYFIPLMNFENSNYLKLEHGKSTIELNDLSESLLAIVHMLIGNDLDVQSALEARNKIMLDPSHDDYIDRFLLGLKDYHRESYDHFRTHGLLLPFECMNAHHNVPNKFLFHRTLGWLLNHYSFPKEGWSMLKVMDFGDKKNLPKNDLYGRLFFYIRDRIRKMVATMQRLPVTFRLFQKDAQILATDFQKEGVKFDRIDVSNISDENYVGIDNVLNDWGPLLNEANPNSAIVTLFLSWYVQVSDTFSPRVENMSKLSQKAVQLIGLHPSTSDDVINMKSNLYNTAILALTDQSEDFEKYLKKELKRKPEYLAERMDHRIVPHRAMYPIDADRNATIDSMPKTDQYYVFNYSTNHFSRYVEWTLA